MLAGTQPVPGRGRSEELVRDRALRLLRQRLADRDEAAARDATTARWQLHDRLVRGDPVRVERP
ncbi:hypothetical protein GCM10009541_07190 [Micromonospora gifhornensis]|uniref:Uncharacterized protein n=1 Tax=Micromonospora gifhornensis TaxID=84594 RepID=A0ABQ4IDN8_9ACTN|nr:hypothetical protein Vgi01_27040 [Micromonospora gifhornensis]